jgi:hypothetical protein
VACFDTAFHHELPRVAQLLAIPRHYEKLGVRRYGFHGLSYEFLMGELANQAGTEATLGRIILAHLGSGASLAAIHYGKPVDTSMGFTPSSGLPMGTRSGDLDPGLVGYLAQAEKMTAQQFYAMATSKSGLLGVSETSSDMRDLLGCEIRDIRAAEAVALFCYQVRKCIGAFAAALGGLDTLVFAGGIGESSPVVRQRICECSPCIADFDRRRARPGSRHQHRRRNRHSEIDSSRAPPSPRKPQGVDNRMITTTSTLPSERVQRMDTCLARLQLRRGSTGMCQFQAAQRRETQNAIPVAHDVSPAGNRPARYVRPLVLREVLVVRALPEILRTQQLLDALIAKAIWEQRYRSITDLEKHLHRQRRQGHGSGPALVEG